MTKLITSELGKASTNMESYYSASSSLVELGKLLDDFRISTSSVLQGGGYEAIRSKMGLYVDAIDKENKLIDKIVADSVVANNVFADYANGYDIDDSSLAELEKTLKKLSSCKIWIENMSEEDFRELFPDESVSFDSYKLSVKQDYEDFRKNYDKIRGLKAEDEYCRSLLSSAESEVNSYNSAVSSINPIEFCNSYCDKIDLSKLKPEDRLLVERLMINWPNDMEEERIKMIAEALALSRSNIKYDQVRRCDPDYMDCSSFVSHLCNSAGLKQHDFSNNGTYISFGIWSTKRMYSAAKRNEEFVKTEPDKLVPGDFILRYGDTLDNNHIAMYLGPGSSEDSYIVIDCNPTSNISLRETDPDKYESDKLGYSGFISYNYGYGKDNDSEEDGTTSNV